jgi:ketosteroid isomerase-like protein
MMDQAEGDVVRRVYEALAARDMALIESCFAPDSVWYVPGDSALSGAHRGWPAIRDEFFGRFLALSGGKVTNRLVDICVGERFVVAVQHATGEHDGRVLDLTACQVIQIRDGKIAEVRGHYYDTNALTTFFGRAS